ncbi:MAG: STAS domain-containing protein [Candidatus Eremiobacteraeota bacterium]|nr:STAS domain-containing protein [Candidatus Eremiobacteraeota bacterium]
MPHDELSIDIKVEHEGSAVVFKLHGSLDIATAPTVRAALLEAANEGRHEIVVDLRGIEFLDSTGLGALIGGHKRALENGGAVRLVVSEGIILRLLTITGLMDVFSVYPSVESALENVNRLAGTL